MSYIKGQAEIGATGYKHWQVLAYFKSKKSLTKAKTYFCEQAHMEPTRSNAIEEYVWKQETRVENSQFQFGKLPMKMNSPLDWAKQLLFAKQGKFDEIDPGVYIRCYTSIKKIATEYMLPPPDASDVTGIWIWGPPGIGKSKYVRDTYPSYFDKQCNKWWDGYKGEPIVLLDDFDLNHKCLGHHLKRWSDRYSFGAEIKGGAIMIRPEKIIVTSNYSIEQIFLEDQTLSAAIKRRFNVIKME
jgi:hypothetical protein